MIFKLAFFLTLAGYAACSILLGRYLIQYAEASELELGYVFMIQPIAIFARPFICAHADRHQSHKKLLAWALFANGLAYSPFVLIPFALKTQLLAGLLTVRFRFWALVVSHGIGSLTFCAIRVLCDSLASNYAKRVGSDYTTYRKYGALSTGLVGFILGPVNQDWILPNYTPMFIAKVAAIFTFLFIVLFASDDYFEMREPKLETSKPIEATSPTTATITGDEVVVVDARPKLKPVTLRQQLAILGLLIRRDFRISLFLMLILVGGLVGYAPYNFVYTYMNQFCAETGTCNASSLAGFTQMCACVLEIFCYYCIKHFRSKLNYVVLLEIAFFSIAAHYFCYGFLQANSTNPHYFMLETLHGLEYAACYSSSVELAYEFSKEVEMLIPELIKRRIVSAQHNDLELVKVSLKATMTAFFTLAFDGLGASIGAFIVGNIIDRYSFTTAFMVNAFLSTTVFFVVILVVALVKCFGLTPKIHKTDPQLAQ